MSLIADALKKAQSARLGRRYAAPDPAGVLQRAREPRRPARAPAAGPLLSGVNISPTLWIGLASGAFLFVALFGYFFLSGGGLSQRASGVGTSLAVGGRPGDLVLEPPSVPGVEPVILEERASAAKTGEAQEARKEESPGPVAEKKPAVGTTENLQAGARPASPARDTQSGAGEAGLPKVDATPALSEEVRHQFNLALFYQEEKNYPQARRAYEKVLQLWPLYAEAHNNLGVVYKDLAMYDKAVVQLQKALTLNPRYPMAYHNLGVVYQLKGEWSQAIKNYDEAIALDRNHLSSYNNLGLVYRAQKRPHEAREVFEKALSLDPAFAQTHYNLALVLEDIGEPERARFHFQKFIDLSGAENRGLVDRVRAHLRSLTASR